MSFIDPDTPAAASLGPVPQAHSIQGVIGTTPSLVQIGTDFSQSTREPLRSIRDWVSRAARLGPPTWSDERISLRPLPRIFVEAHLKSLKRYRALVQRHAKCRALSLHLQGIRCSELGIKRTLREGDCDTLRFRQRFGFHGLTGRRQANRIGTAPLKLPLGRVEQQQQAAFGTHK